MSGSVPPIESLEISSSQLQLNRINRIEYHLVLAVGHAPRKQTQHV